MEPIYIQTYMQTMQSAIRQMTLNSIFCRAWCITVLSAMFAVAIANDRSEFEALAFPPMALFFLMDWYYASLKRTYEHFYFEFTEKLKENKLVKEDLFIALPKQSNWRHELAAVWSMPILWQYLALVVMVLWAGHYIVK